MNCRAALFALFAVGSASCGKTLTATEVMVVVDAEPGVRAQTEKLHVLVSGGSNNAGDRGAFDRTFSLGAGDLDWPQLTALVPSKDDAGRVYEFVASSLDASGNTVAQVRAISGYVPHQRLALRLLLEDGCVGKACGNGLTCKRAECTSAKVDQAKLLPLAEADLKQTSSGSPRSSDSGAHDGGTDGGPSPASDAGHMGGSAGAGGKGGSGAAGSTSGSGGAVGTAGSSGAAGSMSADPCDTNHGGCDALVTCSSSGSTVTCGACPTGYKDTNGDGTACAVACGSAADCCPSDPNKTLPGACGCGTPDTDSDGDGTPDCLDGCPSDKGKTAPGTCGCSFADVVEGCLGLRAALVHRYSFGGTGTTATDSKGAAHGTIVNAQLTGTGSIALSGTTSDQYIDLPNNLLSTLTNATLEAWVTWTGGAIWQRIFDFGNNNNPEGQQGTARTYLFLTPHGGGGSSTNMRVTFSTNGAGSETTITAPLDLPSARAVHVAVVVDDQNNTLTLYQDGVQIGTGAFAGHLLSLNDVNSWLSRSQYTNDPAFGGSIDEFRMYDAALTPAQLMTSFTAGPDATFF